MATSSISQPWPRQIIIIKGVRNAGPRMASVFAMNFNDLLRNEEIDPNNVLVFRHCPAEAKLKKVLPWLAAERPEIFNAYQQTQGVKVQTAMERLSGSGYVASFIGHEAGKALFVGLYSIGAAKPFPIDEFWQLPGHTELREFGMNGISENEGRASILRFELERTDFYSAWSGKLTVGWPGKELSWWRRSERNKIPVLAILEESAFDAAMPEWDKMDLMWEELGVLPARWRNALKQWRGIYYILDTSTRKGYVGSACGEDNLYGRWRDYAARGHGGNRLLMQCNSRNLRFCILQRVSPDMDVRALVSIENSWKDRLQTRAPFGLNDN